MGEFITASLLGERIKTPHEEMKGVGNLVSQEDSKLKGLAKIKEEIEPLFLDKNGKKISFSEVIRREEESKRRTGIWIKKMKKILEFWKWLT